MLLGALVPQAARKYARRSDVRDRNSNPVTQFLGHCLVAGSLLVFLESVLMPSCFCMLWGERGMTPDVKPRLILYAACWTNCFDSRSMSQRLTKSQRPRNTAKFSQRENHDPSFNHRLFGRDHGLALDCNRLPLYTACITHSCIENTTGKNRLL